MDTRCRCGSIGCQCLSVWKRSVGPGFQRRDDVVPAIGSTIPCSVGRKVETVSATNHLLLKTKPTRLPGHYAPRIGLRHRLFGKPVCFVVPAGARERVALQIVAHAASRHSRALRPSWVVVSKAITWPARHRGRTPSRSLEASPGRKGWAGGSMQCGIQVVVFAASLAANAAMSAGPTSVVPRSAG